MHKSSITKTCCDAGFGLARDVKRTLKLLCCGFQSDRRCTKSDEHQAQQGPSFPAECAKPVPLGVVSLDDIERFTIAPAVYHSLHELHRFVLEVPLTLSFRSTVVVTDKETLSKCNSFGWHVLSQRKQVGTMIMCTQ